MAKYFRKNARFGAKWKGRRYHRRAGAGRKFGGYRNRTSRARQYSYRRKARSFKRNVRVYKKRSYRRKAVKPKKIITGGWVEENEDTKKWLEGEEWEEYVNDKMRVKAEERVAYYLRQLKIYQSAAEKAETPNITLLNKISFLTEKYRSAFARYEKFGGDPAAFQENVDSIPEPDELEDMTFEGPTRPGRSMNEKGEDVLESALELMDAEEAQPARKRVRGS